MSELNESTVTQAKATENTATNTKKEKPLKSAKTALLLSLFFGGAGFDRMYLGYWGLGILKLITGGGLGIWWTYDVVKIASLQMKDKKGRPLSLNR